ncbi:MAG: hypothetical protein ACQCN6_12765 [Candidatus Bathyarchaeia archaeon]
MSGLQVGAHNVTVYAQDEYGNVGSSETVFFTVASKPVPVVALAIGVAAVVIAAVGLFLYCKKRGRKG